MRCSRVKRMPNAACGGHAHRSHVNGDDTQPMPIPKLDVHGLLPAGVHDCTLMEIETVFARNAHRRRLYRDFASCFEDELRPRFATPVLVDGSFVTSAEEPNDVDVVLDVMKASRDDQQRCLRFCDFHHKRLMDDYRVDVWPNLPNQDDMAAFFQRLRAQDARFAGLDEHHRKGILRVA